MVLSTKKKIFFFLGFIFLKNLFQIYIIENIQKLHWFSPKMMPIS